MKKQYVVRVVQTHDDELKEQNEGGVISDSFLDCLRYAGLVTVHDVDLHGLTSSCFDIRCPSGLDSKMWAEGLAARMQSFGFNAVVAPKT